MAESFSPYQIDYNVKNTSKTFGFSKKKITFKFGIANPPAVANGESGASCRGSEHEIIFIWSLNSGKRQILCDGKDIHYSETGQNGWTADQVFQHHFQVRVNGLSGPLRAHFVTQPANKDVPHIKPFDLRLNGLSYFSFPQIFQLGTAQMVVRPVKGKSRKSGGGYGGSRGNEDDAHLSPAERQAIAAAKLASMQEMNRPGGGYGASAPAPAVVEDLISFDAPAPAPVAPNPYGQQPPPPQQPQYSNYSLGVPPSPQQPPRDSFASQASYPSQQYQQSQQGSGSFYGQQQPPPQQQLQQSQQGSFYGQQPPAALAPAPAYDPHQQFMTSPSAATASSYQSYGSAPSFAQPPQAQQQPPPMQQQYQQQYQQQGSFYGQPPAPQGY